MTLICLPVTLDSTACVFVKDVQEQKRREALLTHARVS